MSRNINYGVRRYLYQPNSSAAQRETLPLEVSNESQGDMPERTQAELEELAALLANYLKALSPDWRDERIATEVQAVFEERKLYNSRSRRQAFKEKLLTQLEEIKAHPDNWFLR